MIVKVMNEKFENLKVLTWSFNFALFTKLISSFSRINSERPKPSTFLKADLSSWFIIGIKYGLKEFISESLQDAGRHRPKERGFGSFFPCETVASK
jgi:hypothetical protein